MGGKPHQEACSPVPVWCEVTFCILLPHQALVSYSQSSINEFFSSRGLGIFRLRPSRCGKSREKGCASVQEWGHTCMVLNVDVASIHLGRGLRSPASMLGAARPW